jgi:rRNA maturation RNase YbeY
MASVSLVLCDDMHIRALNLQHRNKDAPTDVLSFEMQDELDYKIHLPMKLLGDVVVSMDTARRQAEERG